MDGGKWGNLFFLNSIYRSNTEKKWYFDRCLGNLTGFFGENILGSLLKKNSSCLLMKKLSFKLGSRSGKLIINLLQYTS